MLCFAFPENSMSVHTVVVLPRNQLRNTSISRITRISNSFLCLCTLRYFVCLPAVATNVGTWCLYVEKQCPRIEELFLYCVSQLWSEDVATVQLCEELASYKR